MSNMFYDYLSEKIIKYFQTNIPDPGEKYYIQFENDEQVGELYSVLENNIISSPFVYNDIVRGQKYGTYELDFGKVQLIVAASRSNGPHPDFLATLRNLVGVDDEYINKAILFIHCSSLDSILGGAGSLSKEGMPLNISVIERDIKRKINETGYSNVDKAILEYYLDNKRKELAGSIASIFEYEDIIQCLSDSQITFEEYKNFELFPDDKLSTLTGKKLNTRLEENHSNFVKIAEIHSYGADNSKLENLYGEDGAKALSKPEWEMVPYSEIEKYISSKKNKATIEYYPIISDENLWDREEGDTKAKSRIRNILSFVSDTQEEVSFTLSFSEYTKSVGIEIPKAYQTFLKCVNSGKKLLVTITGIEDKTVFGHFKYNDNGVKYDFRIAVIRCNPGLLENIKTQYSVEIKGTDKSAIRINTDSDDVVFYNGENEKKYFILENNQVVSVGQNETISLEIGEDYPYSENSEDVCFVLSTDNFVIPMIKAFAIEKPTVIEGMKLWYLKRTQKSNFEILGDNSLIFGTKKYWTRDEFRKSLDLEKKYIKARSPFVIEKSVDDEELVPVNIELPNSVQTVFAHLMDYFNSLGSIPSLVYVNSEVESLYKEYLEAVFNEIKDIPEGAYLSEEQKGLFFLGAVKKLHGDQEIMLSPLHPINVAYQLFMNAQNIDGLSDGEYDLLRKFQQTSLLPYINMDPYTKEKKIYIPIEQVHTPEWKVYVDEELPRYKGSKDFVAKLVSEKMREFVEHFSYLFSVETRTPLRINLVNTGDCREIVQGIVRYYAHCLNSGATKEVIPVQIVMYADEKMDNAFETMSKIDDIETLIHTLGLDIKTGNVSYEELIDIYRNNVSFYFKAIGESFEYAHVTFMELDDDHQAIATRMEDIPSGMVMNGMVSGVPSEMLGDSYRTGFGIKYSNSDSELVNVAVYYNTLNAAINGEAYRDDTCYALRMGLNKQKILDRLYDASNWVTFINPKVDLNYFKSDPSAKDLLIIHYSDQYNMTSSGYDAITVTKKSKQYQNAICRYLNANGVDNAQDHSRKIINMFNALNGDWLLRMLSYKSHFPVEKLSILSAMKLATKRYSVENCIWIPVSLEEILRVSGAVGLSQKGSALSAKNLGFDGQTSDDLLLVGIKPGENVKVTFYPIEVKIGKVESDYLEKGVKQALKTRGIIDTILGNGPCIDKNIKTRLYRNFFMQQIMINAGKMLLYEVGDESQNWEIITQSDLRRKLLNEEYEIVDTLIPQMGKAGVISFREECKKEREIKAQNVLIVEKTKKEGVNLLAKDFCEIPIVEWSLITETDTLENDDFVQDEIPEDGNVSNSNENVEQSNNDALLQNRIEVEDEAEEATEIRVLIGEDEYMHNVYWEYGNKALANRHLLITGTSGQGKTYSIQTMLYELNKHNVSAVIFDYTEGFMLNQLEEPFRTSLGDKLRQHIVYSLGVPINPFKRHEIDLAGQKILEKESQVAARLADIFSHVYDFGAQQYSAIFDAALNGMQRYGKAMNMRHFQDELEEVVEANKAAKSVISKMSPFFHTVEFVDNPDFDWGNILYADEAKVNIMQLTIFTREMQVAITELMLWDAWYYTKKYGSKDKPFVVVLDEAQNLSHTMKSPSAAILTEGRKFGWSAWFATQSLKVLKDDEVVRLLQSAFKLYFKPTEDEMVKISKQLDTTGETNWLPVIQRLKKGQCIAVGDKMKPNGLVGPTAPVVVNVSAFDKRN